MSGAHLVCAAPACSRGLSCAVRRVGHGLQRCSSGSPPCSPSIRRQSARSRSSASQWPQSSPSAGAPAKDAQRLCRRPSSTGSPYPRSAERVRHGVYKGATSAARNRILEIDVCRLQACAPRSTRPLSGSSESAISTKAECASPSPTSRNPAPTDSAGLQSHLRRRLRRLSSAPSPRPTSQGAVDGVAIRLHSFRAPTLAASVGEEAAWTTPPSSEARRLLVRSAAGIRLLEPSVVVARIDPDRHRYHAAVSDCEGCGAVDSASAGGEVAPTVPRAQQRNAC